MYHILIVDEEEHLLWALERNLFPDRQDIQVHTASSGEAGLEQLRTCAIDLLVCDLKMPGAVDGFQLILRAKEIAPDARVIIITAFGTHRIQNFAERIGITHYIEKPFSVGELREAVLEILDEKEGFQGVLSDLELTDIIQMLCLARRTALLHLKHRDHRGKIVFERGEVVHAEFNNLVGEEAVYHMLALRQGDIFMQSDFESVGRTIELGWQDLLLEGVRLADEHRMKAEQAEAAANPQITRLPHRPERTLTPHGLGAAAVVNEELAEVWSGRGLGAGDGARGLGLVDSSEAALMFSEAELEEMAMASEAAIVEATDDAMPLSLPALQAHSEPAPLFQVAPSVASRLADEAAERDESGSFAAPSLGLQHRFESEELPTVNGFMAALAPFARECPGMSLTGFISPGEGLAFDFVRGTGYGNLDEHALAAYFGEVVARAVQTVRALDGDDALEELQITLDDRYILLRAVDQTPYYHLAIVEKSANLGIALVLMRQLSRQLVETALA